MTDALTTGSPVSLSSRIPAMVEYAGRGGRGTGIHHHRPRRRVHERHVRVAEEQNVGVHLERAVLRAEKSGLHP